MYTFQDYQEHINDRGIIMDVIQSHKATEAYRIAVDADLYDSQENVTINRFIKKLYKANGEAVRDYTSSNSRISCNFFHRLNTQRVMYSLGSGVSFLQTDEIGPVDKVKAMLGPNFDFDLIQAGLKACEHGVTFLFWNFDRMYVFPLTEFAPLWDEHTGQLRAGVRFWRIDADHDLTVELYEEDGMTRYRSDGQNSTELVMVDAKTPYVSETIKAPADFEAQVIGRLNYGPLPIIPMYGNSHKKSTLVGMRESIDSYDLIRSGFANDLADCAQIYWIVNNAGGMDDADLAEFRDRLKLTHIASVANADDGVTTEPYTQEIPYQARESYMKAIRSEIYESFGALDVHSVEAGATNDHIDAAYQPMDENAADFEHWVSEAVSQMLSLQGIDDRPVFKRNRISNQTEQVEMVVMEAQWLDTATILRKLPNITPEEAQAILLANEAEDMSRFNIGGESQVEGITE